MRNWFKGIEAWRLLLYALILLLGSLSARTAYATSGLEGWLLVAIMSVGTIYWAESQRKKKENNEQPDK